MLQRPAFRAVAGQVALRRAFHSSRQNQAGFFHYHEGPRSNLPFNPLTKFFAVRFWAGASFAFALPFISSYWMSHKG